jgi:GTP diphosphokinase / guanosine-3',5'-bis(diphosphate) 3'-diphosphatase
MKKILDAAFFSARKHTHQRRKNIEDIPYINHPLEVAHLLSSVGGITDEEILCAALLHDTVEDTGTSASEIETLFGPVVTGYVLEVSDNKALPKAERKKLQVKHAKSLSKGATLIKLADRISNLRSIAAESPKGWPVQRQLEYFKWSLEVFDQLPETNLPLEELFRKEFKEGYNKVFARKENEQSFQIKMAVFRKKARAYLLRLGRFGSP